MDAAATERDTANATLNWLRKEVVKAEEESRANARQQDDLLKEQQKKGEAKMREAEAKMREALTASLTADIAAAANEAARDKKDDGKEARIRDGWRASLTAEIGAAAREAAKKRASEIVKVDDPNLSFRV